MTLRREPVRSRYPVPALLVLAALLASLSVSGGLLACGKGVSQRLDAPPLDAAARARYGRRLLADARALHLQGRIEAAERTAERGLEMLPDSAALHRLRAELLEKLGREQEARRHRERADALDPPPPPLPQDPLGPPSNRLLVVLLPPPQDQRATRRAPADWPDGDVHRTLVERLALRLPGARVVPAPDEAEQGASLSSLRRWLLAHGRDAALSLRVDRAYCGESIKDGRFGLARLRAGVAVAGAGALDGEHWIRQVRPQRQIGDGCPARIVARALEQVFELKAFALYRSSAAAAAAAVESPARWTRQAIRLLFPQLEQRISSALDEGRRALELGDLAAARAAFAQATSIDPGHMDARSFLEEVDRTLELTQQIDRREQRARDTGGSRPAPGAPEDPQRSWRQLEPELSPARRRALEVQLAAERRLREDLVATLAVLDVARDAPDEALLASLASGTIRDPEATGPARALAQLRRLRPDDAVDGGALSVRVLYAPSGDLLARYYLPAGGGEAVLLEEDSGGDGCLDRWVAFSGGVRREVWEEGCGGALPNLHIVYGEDGDTLERLDLDIGAGGRARRRFVYREGLLRSEFRDTNGDGRFDRTQHFDDAGAVVLREEDLDHDGRTDVRTSYRSGRMVRREIMNPDILDQLP